jgi:predicted nucleotidyltransferase component of viral defense system
MKPKSILNNYQIDLLDLIKKDNYISTHFYLAGGTTLSEYYLQHRLSDDLDFFTSDKDIDITYIEIFFEDNKEKLHLKSRQRIKKYDRNMINLIYTDGFELKTEFTKYYKPLYPLQIQDGLQIESINDIFLNKIACIIDRYDPKDYIDLFYLRDDKRIDLIDIQTRYEQKFKNPISNSTL